MRLCFLIGIPRTPGSATRDEAEENSMQRSAALSRLGCSGEHTRRSSPAISESSIPKPLSWVRLHSRESEEKNNAQPRDRQKKEQENSERSAAAKKMRRLRLGKRLKISSVCFVVPVRFFSNVKTTKRGCSECSLLVAFPRYLELSCASRNELDALIDRLRVHKQLFLRFSPAANASSALCGR